MTTPKKTKKRTDLTLKEKVALIKESPGQSLRQLAEKFGVGKTQVATVLKRKAEIFEDYEKCGDPTAKRRRLSPTSSTLDEKVFAWFSRLRSLNIPVSGPMLCTKALSVGKDLGLTSFKGSTGWLNKFKKRHCIGGFKMVGEKGSVDDTAVETWLERLPTLLSDFAPKDIFNVDETGLFYRTLPDRTLNVKGSDCSGGKKHKDRITVMLCVNACGEFEKPLVIGKSARPRCWRNTDLTTLPIIWRHNKKAWMVTSMFEEWLHSFNKKMEAQGRHVCLLMDNAPSHPRGLTLSNTKVIFLPPNATSVLQPLDQGIIQAVKLHYRKRFLEFIVSQMEVTDDPRTVIRQVDMQKVVFWLKDAVNAVKPSSSEGCFIRSGIKPVPTEDDLLPPSPPENDHEPLASLLINLGAHINDGLMTATEYLTMDDDLPSHALDEDSDSPDQEEAEDDDDDDTATPDDDELDDKKVLDICARLQRYFNQKGDDESMTHLLALQQTHATRMLSRKKKQTTLRDFFKP